VDDHVLLGIQDLEQRGGRIAADVLPDLVEHQDRIAHGGAPDRLQDAAGHGADVRAAMTAELRLVVEPAEAQPLERAPECARDRCTERRLADARRSAAISGPVRSVSGAAEHHTHERRRSPCPRLCDAASARRSPSRRDAAGSAPTEDGEREW
jgi:hypothetical protein